ncbi:hypothetical protein [Streptomyces sp. AC495_CC817]|uniref:hypothetical protein n=1 Tax=Streptomyces sp. AC495_CC817 TaxID=2823900 RepID=UPI001C25AC2D|nr:hypothetical protein [Streptomyces sp. AC495_CC817]
MTRPNGLAREDVRFKPASFAGTFLALLMEGRGEGHGEHDRGDRGGEAAGVGTRDGSGGREDRDDGGDAAEGAADSEERHLGVPEARVLDGTAVVAGVDLDAGVGLALPAVTLPARATLRRWS